MKTLRTGLLSATAFVFATGGLFGQQQFSVSGTVHDASGEGLSGAMVVALARPDSVLTKWVQTAGDGAFTLNGLEPGDYILQVTLIGHQTLRRDLAVDSSDVAAGVITLEVSAVEVDPLVVSVDHVPFLNRRDTLSYNALAFETRPNATVEDLLRRLPGVEVEQDGSITAQGEEVQNVLVDGKEFFGGDPKIATQNLRANAVKNVRVYDKQSDMAEFTGIADGEEERTIDLELREEARRGYFGTASGGLGADLDDGGSLGAVGDVDSRVGLDDPSDNRTPYNGSLNINRFSPSTQLALIANANNRNQTGFSWARSFDVVGGLRGFSGGPRGGGGGDDDGRMESFALGLNGSRDFGGDSWIRSSYFLSTLDNLQNQTLQRQQLFGTAVSSKIDQANRTQADNTSHRAQVNAQVEFSEGHDLRLRADFTARASGVLTDEFQETRTVDGDLLNTGATTYASDGDDFGGNAQLTWRRRLNDEGRSLVAEARADLDDMDQTADIESSIEARLDDGSVETTDLLQQQTRTGRTRGHSLRLSLTEPLGSSTVVEVFGERSAEDQDEDKTIFDLEAGTPVVDPDLSSGFERVYSYLNGGFRLSRNTDDTRLGFGLRVQSSDLDGTVLDRNEEIANGYTHLLPQADFRMQLDEGRTLNFRYTTRTREPSMTDLQPFTDNSDPLNVYVGNPDLQPEYTHRISGDYRWFDQFSFVNLFTYARLIFTTDNISQSRTIDGRGLQARSPINAGSAVSANGGVHFGTPIRSLGLQVNLRYGINYNTATEFVNGAENRSRVLINSFGAELQNRNRNRIEARTGVRLALNNTDYSLNDELDRSYLNATLYGNGSLYLGDWTLESSINYRTFDQDVFGRGQSVGLWEASLSRLVMGDRVEIRLEGFDLLNQNQGVDLSSSASAISERRSESLGRHVMLEFLYHLGSSPGRNATAGGRRTARPRD